jgi:inorganic triphosphatase YgiF
MRKPSHADAELLLHLYEIRRDPELRRARQWFLTEFQPGKGWAEIKIRYLSHNDEDRWFRMTLSYWEMVGTLVNRGVLHPDLFFDHTGEDIVTWERCKSWIAEARADIRPTYQYQFEKMVADHLAFRVRVAAEHAGASKASAKPAAPKARAARPAPARRASFKG